jgi:hypothetical protein
MLVEMEVKLGRGSVMEREGVYPKKRRPGNLKMI